MYIVLLVIFGILAVFTFIPVVGFVYPVAVVILWPLFGWDSSLVWILMGIVILVNIFSMILSLIASVSTAGVSLGIVLHNVLIIGLCSIIGLIAFAFMILELVDSFLALFSAVGAGIFVATGLAGSGLVVKRTKTMDETCISINGREPVCYGRI